MGTNCHSATKYHYSILNVNFATVHNNFGNNISTASSASAIAAATVKQFRQQQQLILIFNIHICQILALVQNRKKKKAENSRHQSIDLKKCLSLQFFSLSPSLSLNLKEKKNHSDTQEEKNKIELCRLFLLIFKKNHTQTHKVNNPVRAPLSPCHHQHYGHQQHN